MRRRLPNAVYLTWMLALSACQSTDPTGEAEKDARSPVAVTSADTLLPGRGASGYDARHLRLDLRVDPEQRRIHGRADWEILLTERRKTITFDFLGLEVAEVMRDDAPIEFEQTADKLVLSLAQEGEAGDTLRFRVEYSGWPQPVPSAAVPGLAGVGWFEGPDSFYLLAQPDGARSVLPCKDLPGDPFTLELLLTVPEPWLAAAGGAERPSRSPENGWRTYVFEQSEPLPSYLVGFALGEFACERSQTASELPLRLYGRPDDLAEQADITGRLGEMLSFFADTLGPYPGEDLGVVLGRFPEAVSLEGRGLPIFGLGSFEEGALAHHVAHQWFGGAISLTRWRDTFLTEGFAEYGAWIWLEERLGVDAYQRTVDSRLAFAKQESLASPASPKLAEVVGASVGVRGALTLHALRVEMGDEAFFELLRAWVDHARTTSVQVSDFVTFTHGRHPDLPDGLWNEWLFAPALN